MNGEWARFRKNVILVRFKVLPLNAAGEVKKTQVK
jgi:hypothetical protein